MLLFKDCNINAVSTFRCNVSECIEAEIIAADGVFIGYIEHILSLLPSDALNEWIDAHYCIFLMEIYNKFISIYVFSLYEVIHLK